jgi:hypothetical protein
VQVLSDLVISYQTVMERDSRDMENLNVHNGNEGFLLTGDDRLQLYALTINAGHSV